MLEVDEAATLQSSLQAAGLLPQAGIGGAVLEQDLADRPGGDLSAKAGSGGLPGIATDFQEHDNLPDGTWIFQSLSAVYQFGPAVGYFGYESLGCVMGPNGIPLAETLTELILSLVSERYPVGVVDIGAGNTLVRWNTNAMSLYANGQYVMDVSITNVVATNGTPSIHGGFSTNGVEFSYSANDGITYTLARVD